MQVQSAILAAFIFSILSLLEDCIIGSTSRRAATRTWVSKVIEFVATNINFLHQVLVATRCDVEPMIQSASRLNMEKMNAGAVSHSS